jgi:hypothetical protein
MQQPPIVLQSSMKRRDPAAVYGVAFVDFRIMMAVLSRAREDSNMRAFLSACVIAVALAIAGYYGLRAIQEPVSEAFSTSAVRLNS